MVSQVADCWQGQDPNLLLEIQQQLSQAQLDLDSNSQTLADEKNTNRIALESLAQITHSKAELEQMVQGMFYNNQKVFGAV